MLDANRQANHVLADAGLSQLFFVQLAVGGGGWVAGQRLGVADIHQAYHQLQGVDKARTCFDPAVNADVVVDLAKYAHAAQGRNTLP